MGPLALFRILPPFGLFWVWNTARSIPKWSGDDALLVPTVRVNSEKILDFLVQISWNTPPVVSVDSDRLCFDSFESTFSYIHDSIRIRIFASLVLNRCEITLTDMHSLTAFSFRMSQTVPGDPGAHPLCSTWSINVWWQWCSQTTWSVEHRPTLSDANPDNSIGRSVSFKQPMRVHWNSHRRFNQ